MADGNNDGGTNTILIVIFILIVVGLGAWWVTSQRVDSGGVNIQLPQNT